MNLRFALRQLSRTPGYTALAALTLALGIGVNTALYTLIDSVLRRPVVGVGESSALVWIGSSSRDRERPAGISYQDADRLRAEIPLFEDLATSREMPLSIATPSGPLKVEGVAVSGNYFRMARTKFALGRAFTWAEDSAAVTRPVIVLGYEGWQRYFGGDSSILGRTVMVNGLATTVVGVAAAGFNGVEHEELQRVAWVPSSLLAVLLPDWKWMTTDASTTNMRGIARLRSLSDRPRADVALARIAAVIRADDTTRAKGWTLKTYDASSGLPAGGEVALRPISILCFAVTGLILLICCANVANLALARALGREREIATRLSLGASRARIVRQLLGESLLLSAIASIVGLIVAEWAVELILRFALPPLGLDVSLDIRMFVVSAVLGVAAAVLFGLAPALHATRSGVGLVLRSGAVDGGRERTRLQSSLVVTQVALSLTLLTLSGLFIRALDRAQRMEIGFDASRRVLAVSVDVSLQRYDSARTAQFVDQLIQRTRALPGVEGASITTFLPLAEWGGTQVTVDGQTQAGSPATSAPPATFNAITPGYFKTLSIPLMSGRDFTDDDRSNAPLVAIVSEGFARRRFGGAAPLGTRISMNGAKGPWFTVVGVVADAMVRSIDGGANEAVYLPWTQYSMRFSTTVLVRASGADAASLTPSVLGVIHDLDPMLPAFRQLTLDQVRQDATKNERIGATVLAIFGALALVLATVGLYGALLFSVRQRMREIGIRVALGASRAGVISLFLRRGLRLTLIGVAVGIVLALASTQLTRTLLFGVSPTDGVTFVGVAVLFTGVALVASWLPARRAARIDPVIAMRAD